MIDALVPHTALQDEYFSPLYIPPPSGSVDNSAEFWGGFKDIGTGIQDAFTAFGTWVIWVIVLMIIFGVIWKIL